MILGLDFDGTLVESFTANPLPGVRERLHALPAGTRTFLASNQGGPAWRAVTGDPKYPTAAQIAENLTAALGLWALDWTPDLILIATHPGREGVIWQQAADRVAGDLRRLLVRRQPYYVSSDLAWRKPAPGMLLEVARLFSVPPADLLFAGDMESDEHAARAAGARFRWAGEWLKDGI